MNKDVRLPDGPTSPSVVRTKPVDWEAQLNEARARAWDKGYNKGREDAKDWQVMLGRLKHKQSRNPYRHGEEKQ